MPKSYTRGGPLLRPLQASTDAPKSTIEEHCSITAHHIINTKAAQLHPASSSSRGVSPDVANQDVEEDGKKRRKQHRQEVATDDDGGVNERAGGSNAEHAMEAAGSSKRQARPSKDHFEKLVKESCPNHAYPIKHKLTDCGPIESFMTMGSLSRGMEVDEVPTEGDAAPCPREDAIMTIYDRRPSPERRCVPNTSIGTLAHYGRGGGNVEM
jgi:hypothetical protein